MLPDYLDPQLSFSTLGWTAMYNTYLPLLTFRHADGRAGSDVIPGLARGLPRITDGGRTYTLFLRRGLEYSNGTRVKASDFEYALERLFRLRSGGGGLFVGIVGAKRFRNTGRGGISGIVTNNRTGRIAIRLVRPEGGFTGRLALVFAAPVPPSTPPRDLSMKPPPATGPYVITDSGFSGWSYLRNPAWRRANAGLMPQLPNGHADEIEIRVGNASAQVGAIKRGALDWMFDPPAGAQYEELLSRFRGSRLLVSVMPAIYYFWLNTATAPFDSLKVREAVNHAVDPVRLRKIYGGQIAPTQQILPTGMPGHEKFVLFPHDIARARQLVAEADPPDREVTVWIDDQSLNRRVGVYYQRQLEKLGFAVHLKLVGVYEYFQTIGRRSTPNLDTGLSNWFATEPHPNYFLGPLFGSRDSGSNLSRIDIPALSSRLARLRERQLSPLLESQYAALDRSYMEQAPVVPFGSPTQTIFVANRIDLDGVVWNPFMGYDLASLRVK